MPCRRQTYTEQLPGLLRYAPLFSLPVGGPKGSSVILNAYQRRYQWKPDNSRHFSQNGFPMIVYLAAPWEMLPHERAHGICDMAGVYPRCVQQLLRFAGAGHLAHGQVDQL